MWKQVLGVNASLVNEEFRVFLQNREQKAITQVFRAGWISDYNDPYSFLEMFRTGHGRNDYAYSNSTFDALLDEVGTERVRARRERLMFESERVLLSDFVVIPIYTYVTKRLVDQRLRGWENNVMDHHLTRHMFMLKTRAPGAEPPVEPLETGADTDAGADDSSVTEAGIFVEEATEEAAEKTFEEATEEGTEEISADIEPAGQAAEQAPGNENKAEREGDGL